MRRLNKTSTLAIVMFLVTAATYYQDSPMKIMALGIVSLILTIRLIFAGGADISDGIDIGDGGIIGS